MGSSKIFNETFYNYLAQVKKIDLSKRKGILGIQKKDQAFVFDFFNRKIVFSGIDFSDPEGKDVSFAVKVVLCKYILMCPEKVYESSNRLVTFREFSNAGPLFSRFTGNTNKIIETTFSGRLKALKAGCLNLGGKIMDRPSYDLSVIFQALYRIPVIFNFNDKDEILPAKSVLLYHDNAEKYLDPECLSIISTYLTGSIIKN